MIEIVDVYYPGDAKPRPPFLLVRAGARDGFPAAPGGEKWTFWKQVPINIIAVNVQQAGRLLEEQGYYLQ